MEWTTLVLVAMTLVFTVLAFVMAWRQERRARRVRPHGMPGEWAATYKGKRIFVRHTYQEHPDSLHDSDPTGNDTFYVEHGSRAYSSLEDAKAAIRDGSWERCKE